MRLGDARALRAVLLLLGGWMLLRGLWLWPSDRGAVLPQERLLPSSQPLRSATASDQHIEPSSAHGPITRPAADLQSSPLRVAPTLGTATVATTGRFWPQFVIGEVAEAAAVPLPAIADDLPVASASAVVAPAATSLSPARQVPPRFTLSAWTILRPDGAPAALAAGNGQLGASQAGFRLRHDVAGPLAGLIIAANIRASTPLAMAVDREVALGMALRSPAISGVELIVERRLAVDRRGGDRLALLVAGGVDDVRLPHGISLSAYGQAGVAGFASRHTFADGRASFTAKLEDRPRRRISIGAVVAGGAQRDVSRLDIGPQLSLRQRLGSGSVTLATEYRWRIAGRARPPDGPVISVGMDF